MVMVRARVGGVTRMINVSGNVPSSLKSKAVTLKRRGRVGKRGLTMFKMLKRMISRQEETKCMGLSVENAVVHNAQITNADAVALLPVIPQGTGSSNRIGDKIRPVSLKVKGCVSYYDRGQTWGSPMIVKVFCLRQKGLGNLQTALPQLNLPNLLDNGGGTSSWDGSTDHALWRINTDVFDVLAVKTLKISNTDVENHKAETGHYEFSIKPPALLKYSPGNQYPDNYAPFFVLGWYSEDGATPSITDVNIVNTCRSYLYYKDA